MGKFSMALKVPGPAVVVKTRCPPNEAPAHCSDLSLVIMQYYYRVNLSWCNVVPFAMFAFYSYWVEMLFDDFYRLGQGVSSTHESDSYF